MSDSSLSTTSKPASSAATDCALCAAPVAAGKAGPSCQGCPAFADTHYFPHGEGPEDCDVLVLGDMPAPPRLSLVRLDLHRQPSHIPFVDDPGKVLRGAVKGLTERLEFAAIKVRYAYGVRCTSTAPNKAVITACQTPLAAEIARIAERRRVSRKSRPLVVVACGVVALRALDIAVQSAEDAAARTFEITFRGVPMVVVPTMSLKAIAGAVGKYSSVVADLERAFLAAKQQSVRVRERAEIEAGYVYPRTIEEVSNLCDEIIAYTEGGVPAADWAIAFDTETNTLHPHRDGLVVTAVSMAWSTGKACAIPLWHKENKWFDADRAWEHVKRVLASPKPKIGHNWKYDLKVIWKKGFDVQNVSWDVMLAEHALEEDKKGQYSLKYLTKQFLPEYAGYEDKLREILAKLEGEGQAESIETDTADEVVTVSPKVLASLELLGLKPTFQPAALKKKLAEVQAGAPGKDVEKLLKGLAGAERQARLDEIAAAMARVIAAKEAGDFKPQKTSVQKKKESGFALIPLDELLFYAAVDADATRQLAIKQVARINTEEADLTKRRTLVENTLGRGSSGGGSYVVKNCNDPRPVYNLVKRHYIPRMRELARVEYRGVRVDRDYLKQAEHDLEATLSKAEQDLYRMAGDAFKINSGQQLADRLFDVGIGFIHPNPEALQEALERNPKARERVTVTPDGRVKYAVIERTATGQVQTTEAVLKQLTALFDCPFSNMVLTYKKAAKAKNTFLRNADVLSSLDGYLHTSYNLAGTSTGRLSSSDLNMQNIPKGDLGGVKCKRLFIPDEPGMAFVNADAKGAEVSVFAAYSRDPRLIDSLNEGRDTHCFFASMILNPDKVGGQLAGEARRQKLERAGIDDEHAWSYDDFNAREALMASGDPALVKYGKLLKRHRDNTKRTVFGILYGAGPKKIAETAGIDPSLAEDTIKALFAEFPTIPQFIDRTHWALNTFGLVETFDGRRRRFSIRNAPMKLLSQAQRRAVNFLIQGTNSDIVLKVLCWLAPVIERDLGGRVLLTVHDSIGFQVKKQYVSQLPDIMYEYGTRRVARECPWLPVPYRWDVEVGRSYGDVMPIDQYLAAHVPPRQETPRYEGLTEEEVLDELRHIPDDPPKRPS